MAVASARCGERVRSVILAEFPRGLRVERDYDVSIPEFRGDREQLIQAVLNIAHNAAHALSDQRLPPRIITGRLAAHNIFCNCAMSVRPGHVSIGCAGGASGMMARSTSMSSGSAMTTGPGLPLVAT